MSTRPPAVAGSFYPADPGQLRQQVDTMMQGDPRTPACRPQALIVPHAGYVYSGATAACAYREMAAVAVSIRRVLLIGPAHRVAVSGMAIPSVRAFDTPLGSVALEREALDRIARMKAVEISDAAHKDEHCLEVQLPFLQRLLGDFELIPVLVGSASAADVAAVIDYCHRLDHSFVLVSSDLSHFHPYDQACRIDALTCERILDRCTDLRGEEACGARAINGLMTSELIEPRAISLLQSCNSGDTAGNRLRVVGYGAFAIH